MRWSDDGDIIVPLGIGEITSASAAVSSLLRDYDDRTRRFRLRNGEHTPAGRIVRAIYRESIQSFILKWDDSLGNYDDPYRPTRWTHEYPLALGDLLRTLDREAAMLATIAGTSRIDSPDFGEFAALSLPEHVARYELGLEQDIDALQRGQSCAPITSTPQPISPGPRTTWKRGTDRIRTARVPADA